MLCVGVGIDTLVRHSKLKDKNELLHEQCAGKHSTCTSTWVLIVTEVTHKKINSTVKNKTHLGSQWSNRQHIEQKKSTSLSAKSRQSVDPDRRDCSRVRS